MLYTESFKSFITGSILLTSLMSNPVLGRESHKELKQKAELSVFDSSQLNKLTDSLLIKKFEIYKKDEISSNKILFSTGNGVNFTEALNKAQKDVDLKIKFFGKKSNQQIYFINLNNTYHVVILTQIL